MKRKQKWKARKIERKGTFLRRLGQGGKRGALLLLGCILLLQMGLFLSGCTEAPAEPAEALALFCQRYGEALPPGAAYHTTASPWEEGYLSPSLLEALFREGAPGEIPLWGSIYLGQDREIPWEVVILYCRTGEEAERAGGLCASRLKMLRRHAPQAPGLLGAEVLVVGRAVAYAVLPDNERANEILKSVLSG